MNRGAGTRGADRRGRRTLAVLIALTAAMVPLLHVPVASSAPDDRAVDDATVEAGALMSSVPVEVRGSCVVGDATDTEALRSYGSYAASLTATLTCHPADDINVVFYDKFPDTETMRGAFTAANPNLNYPDEFDTCPAYSSYQRSGDDAGLVACLVEGTDSVANDDGIAPGTVILTWTYEPEGILTQVQAADVEVAWAFFDSEGGPLSERSDEGITPIPKKGSLQAAARKLFRLLPAPARKSCAVVDDFRPETLQSLYPARLFIVADVEECRFPHDIEAEYVQFASTESMDAFYDRVASDVEGRRIARLGTFTCPGAGNYDRGKGRWRCYVADVDADANVSSEPYAFVSWTNEKLDVYGFGAAPVGNARHLLRWFVDDAGPRS